MKKNASKIQENVRNLMENFSEDVELNDLTREEFTPVRRWRLDGSLDDKAE